jgi:hypothetical protein
MNGLMRHIFRWIAANVSSYDIFYIARQHLLVENNLRGALGQICQSHILNRMLLTAYCFAKRYEQLHVFFFVLNGFCTIYYVLSEIVHGLRHNTLFVALDILLRLPLSIFCELLYVVRCFLGISLYFLRTHKTCTKTCMHLGHFFLKSQTKANQVHILNIFCFPCQ